ncbi:MAG: NAD(P)/FAD-dependent oxidoreductase [Bacteroidota bacterium]|nr:NAD(P)/FAD-dependent oxidoreductase [Bacteroidota bacterium]
MKKIINIRLTPKQASEELLFRPVAAKKIGVEEEDITGVRILKRSIDARGREVFVQLRIAIWTNEPMPPEDEFQINYQKVEHKKRILIVGSGPAGLFAAIKLIEEGYKPVILERGKQISPRKRDVAQLNRNNPVNPESNYCFGEGGAGTFSDGKLYTRSGGKKAVKRILNILKYHGADTDILQDAHPHIGTNILPRIIKDIREHILAAGGEIHFNTKLVDFEMEGGKIKSVITQKGDKVEGDVVILATGHSAHDIYELLHTKGFQLEAKSFAMGVRIEHSQDLIDSIQYSCDYRGEYLPAATYSLVQQVRGRGVYSFCMCPGGFIVPAVTGPEELVINGMSPSKRNSKFANSGIVVEISEKDFPEKEKYGVLAGLKYQQYIERLAYLNGGKGITAPGQRLTDFVEGRISSTLPETSYHPGVVSSPIHFWLPEAIATRLQKGVELFDNKMNGYVNPDALVLGVETRTSSPLRIPRDKESRQHTQIKNLFPVGEGAGYAGGIVSSAIDGEKTVEILVKQL